MVRGRGLQCWLSNDVGNVFGCVLQFSNCVQNFIEFELIIKKFIANVL